MNKQIKKRIFNTLNKIEKAYKTFVLALTMTFSDFVVASASQPKLVSGTVALFQAASGWLLLVIPAGVSAYVGILAFQKSMTDDQAIIAEKNRHIKNTLIGGIIAVCADSLVFAILNFYK